MSNVESIEVRVRGTVQGVGFRPNVWRIANETQLVGEVFNDAEGVLIKVSGISENVSKFLDQLKNEPPPLAQIETIEVQTLHNPPSYDNFQINHSVVGESHTQVTADAAICNACKAEVLGTEERRHLYPFTNCTHCGPRLTIVQEIPYDRSSTTMSEFPMCERCAAEYKNPADRRFHAQPIACHGCGPKIWIEALNGTAIKNPRTSTAEGSTDHTAHCLAEIVEQLKDGKIIAIRGLGGFHLSCDATNDEAVKRMRDHKHRYAKPFALMAHSLEVVEDYCEITDVEKKEMLSPEAPIVLLPLKAKEQLPESVAPGSKLLGFMLPYTPLHLLITQSFGKPLVMTSGNLSDEPQVTDNNDARDKLKDIADILVPHNREIANRIDDSVVRCMAGKLRLLRRARGYAPRSFAMPSGFEKAPDLLAYGGELKSTFCLLKDGKAIVSQHQGDLEDVSTFEDYEKNLSLYQALYEHQPTSLASDKHPEYLSSKLAKSDASNQELPLLEIQHHHAHIASCMAENGLPLHSSKVLGIAMDGLGYGDDGTFWGGEFLLADYLGSQRLGALKSVPMIGGAQAIREPWRNTYAHIVQALGWDHFKAGFGDSDLCRYLESKPLNMINKMLSNGLGVPTASSCGRLFDAVAAAMDLCRDRAHFEGQGAIELEMLVDTQTLVHSKAYSLEIREDSDGFFRLDPQKMWEEILKDLQHNEAPSAMAQRFHKGLAEGMVAMVQQLSKHHAFDTVALSGGCFQNRVLLESVLTRLDHVGYRCLSQSNIPANDGGLSLGQAAIAAAHRLNSSSTPLFSDQYTPH